MKIIKLYTDRCELGDLPNTLEAIQDFLRDCMECIRLDCGAVMLVGEEHKIKPDKPALNPGATAIYQFRGYRDYILGNALIVGLDGEDFGDLPNDAANLYLPMAAKAFDFFRLVVGRG